MTSQLNAQRRPRSERQRPRSTWPASTPSCRPPGTAPPTPGSTMTCSTTAARSSTTVESWRCRGYTRRLPLLRRRRSGFLDRIGADTVDLTRHPPSPPRPPRRPPHDRGADGSPCHRAPRSPVASRYWQGCFGSPFAHHYEAPAGHPVRPPTGTTSAAASVLRSRSGEARTRRGSWCIAGGEGHHKQEELWRIASAARRIACARARPTPPLAATPKPSATSSSMDSTAATTRSPGRFGARPNKRQRRCPMSDRRRRTASTSGGSSRCLERARLGGPRRCQRYPRPVSPDERRSTRCADQHIKRSDNDIPNRPWAAPRYRRLDGTSDACCQPDHLLSRAIRAHTRRSARPSAGASRTEPAPHNRVPEPRHATSPNAGSVTPFGTSATRGQPARPRVTCVRTPVKALCARMAPDEVLVKVERPQRSEDVRP